MAHIAMNPAGQLRGCLSVADAARFAATDPGSTDQALALAHVDTCSRCRQLVAEAVRAPGRGHDDMVTGTFQPGEIVGERYEIREPLGAGGMGEVYEARDSFLRDTVAL